MKSASPALYDVGFLQGLVNGDGVSIKGISIGSGAPVPEALQHLKAGSIEALRNGEGELPGIILGSRLAERIGAVVGKPVTLTIANGHMTPFGPRPS